MTAHVLVSGTLYRAPEQKTSKAGKPFVVATIRAKDGDGSQWWKVMCFSESAGAELLRLADGDALSVQGSMRAELWTPEGGEARVNLTVFADSVLALRPAAKPRTKKEKTEPQRPAPADRGFSRHAGNGEDYFGDAIPF
ncbi:single-stranded DNA-binding protein [Methylosinus sp. PW1]|uniref:single-stranded DNA-binding protein n=1 Tax=Methylosinus sp. PW1 TaxID=107636 RepID=UPI00068B894F|nr:single-stranded DNA-binding protein [Methylosinus sp. PW1]